MITSILIFLAYLWASWGLYVLVVGLYRAYMAKRLNRYAIFLSIPFVAIGFIVDILSNITLATILFWELPKELLVTARLVRHLKNKNTWRFYIAQWICKHLLDPVDPSGSHCKL
jgi:hypothetical protein